ncbi:GL13120 [Drosophila persimilis]|uniref:GL13120 n=1 Tax=Drosophila persimilis TaxID=7234 RepID=B4GV92_DROPE|nr:GL13120 [Drosophila persimilis]
MPTVAASFMSEHAQVAHFAVAYQNKVLLHFINCADDSTVTHEVREPHLMPRFLYNLAGALRQADSVDAVNYMSFSEIDGTAYLLVVYRSNELRLWSVDTMQAVSTINCSDGGQGAPTAQGQPPPEGYCLTMQHGIDPREAYCSYIFHPGRFDRTLITKALYMFRRVNMQFDVRQLSMTVLKERVCQAVKDEIQNEFKEFVAMGSCLLLLRAIPHQVLGAHWFGFSILGAMDAACLIRWQSFALPRPCELWQHILFIGEQATNVTSLMAPFFPDNLTMTTDVKVETDKKLYQRESTIDLAAKLAARSIDDDYTGAILPMDTDQKPIRATARLHRNRGIRSGSWTSFVTLKSSTQFIAWSKTLFW